MNVCIKWGEGGYPPLRQAEIRLQNQISFARYGRLFSFSSQPAFRKGGTVLATSQHPIRMLILLALSGAEGRESAAADESKGHL
jgi:hypothetical protein